MARTVSEGLSAIANADLSGLSGRIDQLRAEALKKLEMDKAKIAQMTIDELMSALEAAKRRAT